MRCDLFDPEQDRAYRKIGIGQLVAHDDDSITITRVLVENASQERELLLYRRPLLLSPPHMLCPRDHDPSLVTLFANSDGEMVLHTRG